MISLLVHYFFCESTLNSESALRIHCQITFGFVNSFRTDYLCREYIFKSLSLSLICFANSLWKFTISFWTAVKTIRLERPWSIVIQVCPYSTAYDGFGYWWSFLKNILPPCWIRPWSKTIWFERPSSMKWYRHHIEFAYIRPLNMGLILMRVL